MLFQYQRIQVSFSYVSVNAVCCVLDCLFVAVVLEFFIHVIKLDSLNPLFVRPFDRLSCMAKLYHGAFGADISIKYIYT